MADSQIDDNNECKGNVRKMVEEKRECTSWLAAAERSVVDEWQEAVAANHRAALDAWSFITGRRGGR